MKMLFTSLLLVLSCLAAQAQYLYITLPLDRTVLQRNDIGNGSATVVIAGQITEPPNPGILPTNFTVKYRLVPVSKTGTLGTIPPWTNIGSSTPYGGVFYTTTTANTGWYQLQVGAFDPIYGGGTPSLTGSVLVGVGEVVFIAGQSNAQGTDYGTNDAVSTTYYDCVNSINDDQFCRSTFAFPNIQKIESNRIITPNSNRSAWGFHYLGKQIVDGLTSGSVTPVLFFNAGSTATSVGNWNRTAYDPNAISRLALQNGDTCCAQKPIWPNSDGPQGQPYKGLKTSLNYFGGMFGARGVIWHQGETETIRKDSNPSYNSDYVNRLNYVIAKTRSDFDSGLNWYVSTYATYYSKPLGGGSFVFGITDATIQSNQVTVASSNYYGASTDSKGKDFRHPQDYTHLNENPSPYQGLTYLADSWNSSLNASSNNGVVAPTLPQVSLTYNASANYYTATAPGGYSDYKWVENYGELDNGVGSGPSGASFNIPLGSYQGYRCWVKNSSGNWSVTPIVYEQKCRSGARLAAEQAPGLREVEKYNLTLFPNPSAKIVNVKFDLPISAQVQLKIINQNGQVLKNVADNLHAEGSFTYPVDISFLQEGIYLCQPKANDISITKKLIVTSK